MNNMKKFTLITATLAFFVSNALADEGVVRAKASLGVANYSSPYGTKELKSSYSTQGLSLAYILPSSIFVELGTKISGSSATYNAAEAFGNLVTTDQKFSRTENTLTIGMTMEDGVQLNAGYFNADTIFKLAQYGQYSQKISGLTAGVGKGAQINEGKSGSVGVSAVVALIDATNTDRFGVATNSDLSYGASLGAVYSYPINKNMSVSVDAKFQTYFISYTTFSGDEKILSSAVSLIGQF